VKWGVGGGWGAAVKGQKAERAVVNARTMTQRKIHNLRLAG